MTTPAARSIVDAWNSINGGDRMVATLHAEPGARPGVDNLILVSSDTHIGPLTSQLREYCPSQYLDDFDAFAAQMQAQSDPTGAGELREAMAHLSLEEKEALLAQLNDPTAPSRSTCATGARRATTT